MPPPDHAMLEVRRFVAAFRHEPVESVLPETTLPYDLGIDGDEAYDLLESFGEQFDIDFADLWYHEHFGDEGIPLRVSLVLLRLSFAASVLWAWRWWAGTTLIVAAVAAFVHHVRLQDGFAHPLTVRDLANAASAGTWNYPYPTDEGE